MINVKDIYPYDYDSTASYYNMFGPEYGTDNPWRRKMAGTGTIQDPGRKYNYGEGATKQPAGGATGQQEYKPGEQTIDEDWSLQYPEQWNTANDWLTNFLKEGGGQADKIGYTNVEAPGIWGNVSDAIIQMLGEGAPVDTGALYDAAKAVGLRDLEENAKGMAEKFDVGGLRFSTPLQANITRESERLSENLANQQAQANIAAQENARSRMMQAMGLGTAQGSAEAGLGLSNAGNQLTADVQNAANQLSGYGNQLGAVNSLIGLGSNYAQLPLQVAGSMDQLNQSMYGQDQSALNNAQMNPWLNYAMQLSGQSPYGIQQGYQPSTWTQLLGGLSGSLPYLSQLFGGKNQTTGSYDPTALIQDYLRKQANQSWTNRSWNPGYYYGDSF